MINIYKSRVVVSGSDRDESEGRTRKATAGDDGLKFDTDFFPNAWLRTTTTAEKKEQQNSRASRSSL